MLSNLFRDSRVAWFPFLATIAPDTENLAGRLLAIVRLEKAMSPVRERPAAGNTRVGSTAAHPDISRPSVPNCPEAPDPSQPDIVEMIQLQLVLSFFFVPGDYRSRDRILLSQTLGCCVFERSHIHFPQTRDQQRAVDTLFITDPWRSHLVYSRERRIQVANFIVSPTRFISTPYAVDNQLIPCAMGKKCTGEATGRTIGLLFGDAVQITLPAQV